MQALRRVAATTVRWRYAILLLLTAASFWPAYCANGGSRPTGDWLFFKVGGFVLTHDLPGSSEAPLHLYADNPALQIGPPPLVIVAVTQKLTSPATATLGLAVVMALAGPLVVALMEATARRLTAPADSVRVATVTLGGGAILVVAEASAAGVWRHLDDALALVAVSVAMAVLARRGPPWIVGAALGVAVACKPWAIVSVPLVLGLPISQRSRCLCAFVVSATVWWIPFLVAAPDTAAALGGFHLVPDTGSVPYALGLRGDLSAWLRPVQFGLGTLAAVWVAQRRSWVAAPLAGLAGRVALDPYVWSYYGMGPLLAAVACDLCLCRRRLPLWTLATVVALYAVPHVASAAGSGLARALWAAAVLIRLGISSRGSDPLKRAEDGADDCTDQEALGGRLLTTGVTVYADLEQPGCLLGAAKKGERLKPASH